MTAYDAVVPPGGRGKIQATVGTHGLFGGVRKVISVSTNDPERPSLVLAVSFVVATPLVATPPSVAFFVAQNEAAAPAEVVVRRADGAPLELSDLSIDDTAIAVSLAPAGADRAEARIAVTLKTTATARRIQAKLQAKTNHPLRPLLALDVFGAVRPLLWASPQTVALPRPPGGAETRANVTVQNTAGRPFRLLEARLEGEIQGCSASVLSTAAASLQVVQLACSGPPPAAPRSGRLVMTTDVPGYLRLETPISVVLPQP